MFIFFVFVKLQDNMQRQLVGTAIVKAGSERKLAQLTGMPSSMVYYYKNCFTNLPFERFKKLVSFIGMQVSDFDFELIDPVVYRQKGGRIAFENAMKSGKFHEIHKKMRVASSLKMAEWHRKMAEHDKKKYFELQYGRFKKIGGYKFKTNRGELVRNCLERDVANLFFEYGIAYVYEPYAEGEERVYFPDFVIGKMVVECTAWKGPQKAYALSKKISDLEKKGFNVVVVVPENLRKHYKLIQGKVLNIEQLKSIICPSSSDKVFVLQKE